MLVDEVAATAASIGGAAYVVDLRDADAARATVGAAIAALGGIDVLVNNAGILRFAPFLDISPTTGTRCSSSTCGRCCVTIAGRRARR